MLDDMEPTAQQINLPEGYGKPTKTLGWGATSRRLDEAERYWLATTRPDGRPHVVPVDGVWLDGVWFFGGADQTVHQRNLRQNRRVVVHLEDAAAAVIMEGTAERMRLEKDTAERLAAATRAKYGYPVKATDYDAEVWGVRPAVVLAWDALNVDATRFRFPERA